MNFKVIITFLLTILTFNSLKSNVSCRLNQIINKLQGQHVRTVAILTRHAERTPLTTYPGDVYREYFNQIGYGQLTKKGCHRMYKIGNILKTKFNRIKNPSRIVLKSSSSARCLQTMRCLMAGFDRKNKVNWLESQSLLDEVQVISDAREDALLNHAGTQCPMIFKEMNLDADYCQIPQKYPLLWSNLSQATGQVNSSVHAVLHDLLDPILSEYELNLPLPKWITKDLLHQSYSAIDSGFNSLVRCKIEQKLSSVFLNDLVNNMNSSSSKETLFIAYSTHDTTLGPIMYTVGAWSGFRPKYGESLIFVHHSNGQFRSYYFNNKYKFKQFTPIGCSKVNCTFDKFVNGVSSLSISDWKVECNKN